MRSFGLKSFLFFCAISLIFVSIDSSSTCKKKHKNLQSHSQANDVNEMKSFRNLSGNALEKAIVDEILEQSKINSQIHLRHLGIPRLTKDMLKNITNIHSIDFQSNKITEIENGSFTSGEKLEKIDLMENHLTKVTKHIFSGNFHELFEINLSFNAIDTVESGSFDRFVRLKSIDVSSNCIQHLHSDLFEKCSELKQVYLSNNRLQIISEHIFKASIELYVLDLSHNNFEAVPKLKVKRIKQLDVSHNDIKKLDLKYETSRKLAHVEELSVAHNSITKFGGAGEMRNDILRLDMSHNQINDLHNFPFLRNLEALQLSHNKISRVSVRKLREHFPSLKALNMSVNKLNCDEYLNIQSSITHVFINLDCANLTVNNDNILSLKQSKNDEIASQLQLNSNILIIVLSAFVIFTTLPIAFVLYTHLRKRMLVECTSNENLIEQIELGV